MNAPGSRLPRRTLAPARLAALAIAVLAAHLLLLIGLPQLTVRPAAPPPVRPLLTRTLPAPAPPPAVESPKPTPPVAPPRPRLAPKLRPARPAQPTPSAAPQTSPEPAGPPLSDAGTDAALAEAPPPEAGLSSADQNPSLQVAPAEPGTTVGPVAVPGSARLSYSVQAEAGRLPYRASAELLWRHDATQYEANLTISAFLIGSRSQSSVGSLTPQGLAPTRFADRARRGEQAAHFDHNQGRITFSANTPEARLLPGAQDRLSLFLQLGALIAGQPDRFAPGSKLTVQTAGTRDAEAWVLSVEREETLQLAGQNLPSLKLLRQPRHEYDTLVEVWLARTLDYLPVRIRITQANGDFVDQQLSAIERP